MMYDSKSYRTLWFWSFALFLLAAATGFLYRLEMMAWLPWDLSLTNIRHAHSHLMFFSWVTPVPMLFMASRLIRRLRQTAKQVYVESSGVEKAVPVPGKMLREQLYGKNRESISMSATDSLEKSLLRTIAWIIAIGFATWPFFLLYGYGSVKLAGAELPLSVILSGVIMLFWYRFAWLWFRNRLRGQNDGVADSLFDGALFLLTVSTLGAWGLSLFQFTRIDMPLLSGAMTHFFLALFTQGWCLLSALGMIYDILGIDQLTVSENLWLGTLLFGAPLMFPFGLSADLLNTQLLWAARAGAVLTAIGLAIHLKVLTAHLLNSVRVREQWWWPLIVVMLVAITIKLTASVVAPDQFWIGNHGLRVLYLHLLLLGVVTLTYLGVWHSLHPQIGKKGFGFFVASILFMIASLFTLTGWLPAGWPFGQTLLLLTIAAFLPLPVAIQQAVIMWRAGRTVKPLQSSGNGSSGPSNTGGAESTALLEKIDDMDASIENQEKTDHVGDRSGIGDNQKRKNKHEYTGNDQFETDHERDAKKREKNGKGIRDQFGKEEDQKPGKGSQGSQERTYAKIEQKKRQGDQIPSGNVVDQIWPAKSENACYERKDRIKKFPLPVVTPDDYLDVIHTRECTKSRRRFGNRSINRFHSIIFSP
jgi:hypothetical protein